MKENIYLNSLVQDLCRAGILSNSEWLETTDDENSILSEAEAITGQISVIESPVQSIFSVLPVRLRDEPPSDTIFGNNLHFPFMAMNLEDTFFPQSEAKGSKEDVKKRFQEDYQKIAHLELFARGETLLHLMHKYCTVIPAGKDSAISLYDHAKLKAAIAVCLSDKNEKEKPFLLVGGDLSGIQEFIFDIVSKNAAKNLKGRSFYLHLLIDGIVQRFLQDTGLTQANIVFASGGKFYVLTPNNETIISEIKRLEQEITVELFEAHKVGLSITLDWLELSKEQLSGSKLGSEIWMKLQDNLRNKKRSRFNVLISENFDDLFEAKEAGGETRRDAITNEEINDEEAKSKTVYTIGDAVPKRIESLREFVELDVSIPVIKKSTQQQIMAGFFLRDKTYRLEGDLAFELDIQDDFQQDREMNLPGHRSINYLLNNDKYQRKEGTLLKRLSINDPKDFLLLKNDEGSTINGFEFYGGNDFPLSLAKGRDGRDLPKTFSEMAGAFDEERSKDDPLHYKTEFDKLGEASFKRLAILRMDIDGLSGVFRNGFGEHGTLAHFSALSRQLDWFFKGYLNTLWKKGVTGTYDWKAWTQIIYSGGDDLFIVGKWDCLIDFAEQIRSDLKKWTCHHAGIDISGGLVLVTHKYPIIKAAAQCGSAEYVAKQYQFHREHQGNSEIKYIARKESRFLIKEKNAITIFDLPLNWESEYKIVKNLKEDFVRLVKGEDIPRSIMMGLAAFYERKSNQKKLDETPTWRWQVAYQLARSKDRVKSKEGKEFVEQLSINIFTQSHDSKTIDSNYDYFDLLNVAIRWAEYDLRSERNKSSNTKRS
jgi:CRISPR-associated protein Csm1